ncbi:hypothetical protein H5410_030266 [Solanum commersonii]|uniref:Uncharacterized protein n=1 Tax=Solanum commersonii TaxID=4109 RepID=A0A9J5YGY3_SOLCO|nr:hypothetical protein H5410_030266 [Solanum commersonii]
MTSEIRSRYPLGANRVKPPFLCNIARKPHMRDCLFNLSLLANDEFERPLPPTYKKKNQID